MLFRSSAIYNPGFPDTTYLTADINGKATEGVHSQYTIAKSNWFVDKRPDKGNIKNDDLTIEDSKNLDIKKIKIHSGRFGDDLDGHCDIGPESGRPPNLNADEYKDPESSLFGIFEDVSVPVLHLEYPKAPNESGEVRAKTTDDYVTYVNGSSAAAVIRFANLKKDAFKRIRIDGEVLDTEDYSISDASDTSADAFDITLKDEYLKTLAAGKHKVEVRTTEGSADGTSLDRKSVV